MTDDATYTLFHSSIGCCGLLEQNRDVGQYPKVLSDYYDEYANQDGYDEDGDEIYSPGYKSSDGFVVLYHARPVVLNGHDWFPLTADEAGPGVAYAAPTERLTGPFPEFTPRQPHVFSGTLDNQGPTLIGLCGLAMTSASSYGQKLAKRFSETLEKREVNLYFVLTWQQLHSAGATGHNLSPVRIFGADPVLRWTNPNTGNVLFLYHRPGVTP